MIPRAGTRFHLLIQIIAYFFYTHVVLGVKIRLTSVLVVIIHTASAHLCYCYLHQGPTLLFRRILLNKYKSVIIGVCLIYAAAYGLSTGIVTYAMHVYGPYCLNLIVYRLLEDMWLNKQNHLIYYFAAETLFFYLKNLLSEDCDLQRCTLSFIILIHVKCIVNFIWSFLIGKKWLMFPVNIFPKYYIFIYVIFSNTSTLFISNSGGLYIRLLSYDVGIHLLIVVLSESFVVLSIWVTFSDHYSLLQKTTYLFIKGIEFMLVFYVCYYSLFNGNYVHIFNENTGVTEIKHSSETRCIEDYHFGSKFDMVQDHGFKAFCKTFRGEDFVLKCQTFPVTKDSQIVWKVNNKLVLSNDDKFSVYTENDIMENRFVSFLTIYNIDENDFTHDISCNVKISKIIPATLSSREISGQHLKKLEHCEAMESQCYTEMVELKTFKLIHIQSSRQEVFVQAGTYLKIEGLFDFYTTGFPLKAGLVSLNENSVNVYFNDDVFRNNCITSVKLFNNINYEDPIYQVSTSYGLFKYDIKFCVPAVIFGEYQFVLWYYNGSRFTKLIHPTRLLILPKHNSFVKFLFRFEDAYNMVMEVIEYGQSLNAHRRYFTNDALYFLHLFELTMLRVYHLTDDVYITLSLFMPLLLFKLFGFFCRAVLKFPGFSHFLTVGEINVELEFDVYISFCADHQNDRRIVLSRLIPFLKRRGRLRVTSGEQIHPGENLMNALANEMQKSKIILIFWSHNFEADLRASKVEFDMILNHMLKNGSVKNENILVVQSDASPIPMKYSIWLTEELVDWTESMPLNMKLDEILRRLRLLIGNDNGLINTIRRHWIYKVLSVLLKWIRGV